MSDEHPLTPAGDKRCGCLIGQRCGECQPAPAPASDVPEEVRAVLVRMAKTEDEGYDGFAPDNAKEWELVGGLLALGLAKYIGIGDVEGTGVETAPLFAVTEIGRAIVEHERGHSARDMLARLGGAEPSEAKQGENLDAAVDDVEHERGR